MFVLRDSMDTEPPLNPFSFLGNRANYHPPSLLSKMEARNDGRFKILSIDGGGIRGIVPLKVLVELEGHIGPVSDTFDLISGTSTGGIIALSLTGSPQQLTAKNVLHLYETEANKIFMPNPGKRLHDISTYAVSRLVGEAKLKGVKKLIDCPTYTRDGLDKLANDMFGEQLLKDVSTNIYIPAIDITTPVPQAHFFNNRDSEDAFLALKDVAGATSAAPTYFLNKKIANRAYVDGGLGYNNPAQEACFYAERQGVRPDAEYVLSLGTGFADIEGIGGPDEHHNLFYWAKQIFTTVNATQCNTVNQNLQSKLHGRYWRMNPKMEREIDLDDVKPATIQELCDLGNDLVERESENIREIARQLRPDKF